MPNNEPVRLRKRPPQGLSVLSPSLLSTSCGHTFSSFFRGPELFKGILIPQMLPSPSRFFPVITVLNIFLKHSYTLSLPDNLTHIGYTRSLNWSCDMSGLNNSILPDALLFFRISRTFHVPCFYSSGRVAV